MKTYNNFTEAYHGLIKTVYENPEFEAAPRGMAIRECLGQTFRITNIRDRIPYIPHRDFSIAYMIGELVWYLSGDNSTEWISSYSAFWRNISDDGLTANSAYGARIFRQHPYQNDPNVPKDWTQWSFLKEELARDPDSRRAVIHVRMPQDSYLAQKDVPCTLTLQFFIRDGALHQVASMRSSDLILGLAYDVPAFTVFQELLAFELGVNCGTYTHISNSLHIYERHHPMVEKILKDPWLKKFPTRAQPMPTMPSVFPIEEFAWFDHAIRPASNEVEIMAVVKKFVIDSEIESYWTDWMLVMASHRARQLGRPELRENLLGMSKFSGYSLFNK